MASIVIVLLLLLLKRNAIKEYINDAYEFNSILGTATLINMVFSIMAFAMLMFLFEVYGIYLLQLIFSIAYVEYMVSLWKGVSR